MLCCNGGRRQINAEKVSRVTMEDRTCDGYWQQANFPRSYFHGDDSCEKQPKAERRLDSWRPIDYLQARKETKYFPHLHMAQVKKQSAHSLLLPDIV
jgi:hypothetical protein